MPVPIRDREEVHGTAERLRQDVQVATNEPEQEARLFGGEEEILQFGKKLIR